MRRETLKLIDVYISECETIFNWKNIDTDKPMKFIERVKKHSDDLEKIVLISFIIISKYRWTKINLHDFMLSSGKILTDDTENIEILIKVMSKLSQLRSNENLFNLLTCDEFSLFQKLEFIKNAAQSISTTGYIRAMNYLSSVYHNDLKTIIEVCMGKINSVIVNKLDIVRRVNKTLGKGQIILDPKVTVEIPDNVTLFLDLGV